MSQASENRFPGGSRFSAHIGHKDDTRLKSCVAPLSSLPPISMLRKESNHSLFILARVCFQHRHVASRDFPDGACATGGATDLLTVAARNPSI